jgi:hypothetical protein
MNAPARSDQPGMISNAVKVMRIATGDEVEEFEGQGDDGKDKTA